jgi:hypothetical protein
VYEEGSILIKKIFFFQNQKSDWIAKIKDFYPSSYPRINIKQLGEKREDRESVDESYLFTRYPFFY